MAEERGFDRGIFPIFSLIVLGIFALAFLSASASAGSPDFKTKWKICDLMNISDRVKCDEFWYNSSLTKVIFNYTILQNTNLTSLVDNLKKNFAERNLTYNKTEVDSLMKDLNKSLSNFQKKIKNETSSKVDSVNKSLLKRINNLQYSLNNRSGEFGGGWKFFIFLIFVLVIGIIGFIAYQLKSSDELS